MLAAIRAHDDDALARSLAGVLSVRVEPLLRDVFFQGHEALAEAVLAQTTADRLHHIGVEISRPLDEIERDIDGLLVRLGQATGGRVELAWRRRFPASKAFRRRVGAAAEILCLCLGVDGRMALLELFDLHRPPSERDTTLPPHYAVGLGSRRAVERLHREFAALAKRQPRYVLAYSAPVENRRDGSFHTKLVNRVVSDVNPNQFKELQSL
jgi:hypothetical protein